MKAPKDEEQVTPEFAVTANGKLPSKLTEHKYTLMDEPLMIGTPADAWAHLVVRSRAKLRTNLPLFLDGDMVTGSVVVDLSSKKKMKAVTLTLEGEILRAYKEPSIFYTETIPLWIPDDAGNSHLKGKHTWPFSIALPQQINENSMLQNSTGASKAPPTFTLRRSTAYIEYRLIVTFQKGVIRGDSTLMTGLNYLRCDPVPPPSSIRHAAYEEDGQMAGPKDDPAGWKEQEPVILSGTVFGKREFEIKCEFAVGCPILYCPNTPVPIWIVLSSSDAQALKFLLASNALKVNFRCSVALGEDAEDDNRIENRKTTFTEVIAEGKTWPIETHQIDSDSKEASVSYIIMEGEIFVPVKSRPSFIFPGCSIRYYVDFVLGETPGLDIKVLDDFGHLASQKVDVAVDPEARPITRSREPSANDMNQIATFKDSSKALTLANHRFLRAAFARSGGNRLVSYVHGLL